MPLDPNRLKKLREGSVTPSFETVARIGEIGLSGLIGETVRDHDTSGLDCIENPETRKAFEQSFRTTDAVYKPLGLEQPTLMEWMDKGVNFLGIAAKYERMQSAGFEPEILITAHLGIDDTTALFKEKTFDNSVPKNPLREFEAVAWGMLDIGLRPEDWEAMDIPHAGQPVVASTGHTTTWTFGLITGSRMPQLPGDQVHAVCPTVSQYLRLQLGRIQEGRIPVDGVNATSGDNQYYSTWLDTTGFDCDTDWGVYGSWNERNGIVHVNHEYVGDILAGIGYRDVIW